MLADRAMATKLNWNHVCLRMLKLQWKGLSHEQHILDHWRGSGHPNLAVFLRTALRLAFNHPTSTASVLVSNCVRADAAACHSDTSPHPSSFTLHFPTDRSRGEVASAFGRAFSSPTFRFEGAQWCCAATGASCLAATLNEAECRRAGEMIVAISQRFKESRPRQLFA